MRGNGLLHIEKSTGWAAEKGDHLPHAYGLCEGSWSEFVDDIKRTIRSFVDEVRGWFEDVREALRARFRRKSAIGQEAVAPTRARGNSILTL
jgi:hypothetical protein